MKTFNLDEFTKGWFIGDFEPSILMTKDFEIALHYLKSGDESDGHYHTQSVEYNLIIDGILEVNGKLLVDKDIFIYDKYERSNVKCLSDTTLIVIKSPSVPYDKEYHPY